MSLYGEGWWDGTPEGFAAYTAAGSPRYKGPTPFVPPAVPTDYVPGYSPTDAMVDPPIGANVWDILIDAGIEYASGGTAADIAAAALAAAKRGREQNTGYVSNLPSNLQACPDGWTKDANGQCILDTRTGMVQRGLPGGKTGTMADAYGQAVLGAFGIPALVPRQVGTIQRKDGSQNPILRCPPGAVLGRDSLCYMKGSIPRNFRLHPPDPRPIISARDGKIMMQARGVEKRVKKISGKYVHKACSCARKAPRGKK